MFLVKPRIAIAILDFLVDENDLNGGKKIEMVLLLNQFHENFRSETPRCRKLGHSSEIQNDVLMQV